MGLLIDPETAGEGELLFAPGFEHDLVGPAIIHPGAVDQVVTVKAKSEVGDRAHEILLKDGQVVIVDIDILCDITQELGDRLVADSGNLAGADDLLGGFG